MQLLDGVLSALLDTVKVFKEEQMRADELGTTRNIDGRRDVEELVRRNAHSTHPLPAGSAIRARSGQGDGVNEASLHHGTLIHAVIQDMDMVCPGRQISRLWAA